MEGFKGFYGTFCELREMIVVTCFLTLYDILIWGKPDLPRLKKETFLHTYAHFIAKQEKRKKKKAQTSGECITALSPHRPH